MSVYALPKCSEDEGVWRREVKLLAGRMEERDTGVLGVMGQGSHVIVKSPKEVACK